jgi:molybdenum cofactor cytidylyltransferase
VSAGRGIIVGGVLLAAGAGRRFGGDKREAHLTDGQTVLERSVALLRGCCDELLIAIGARDDPAAFSARFPGVRVLRSARSAGGMGLTLADAIAAAPASWQACLVSLADKPFIRPATARRVRELLTTHEIVVPVHVGAWGHPVGFARCHFSALARLEGDAGARSLVEAERARACFVEVDDPGILADVDTPADLQRFAALLERPSSPRDGGSGLQDS